MKTKTLAFFITVVVCAAGSGWAGPEREEDERREGLERREQREGRPGAEREEHERRERRERREQPEGMEDRLLERLKDWLNHRLNDLGKRRQEAEALPVPVKLVFSLGNGGGDRFEGPYSVSCATTEYHLSSSRSQDDGEFKFSVSGQLQPHADQSLLIQFGVEILVDTAAERASIQGEGSAILTIGTQTPLIEMRGGALTVTAVPLE